MSESEKLSKKEERKKTLLYISGVGMGVGSELIVLVAAGVWIGKWIDRSLNSAPYGTLISTLFFLGAGLTHIILVLVKMQKKLESLRDENDKSEKT